MILIVAGRPARSGRGNGPLNTAVLRVVQGCFKRSSADRRKSSRLVVRSPMSASVWSAATASQ